MSKRQNLKSEVFTFSPFKRHSFTFIRLSGADKTRKVYREKRTFMLGQGEEKATFMLGQR